MHLEYILCQKLVEKTDEKTDEKANKKTNGFIVRNSLVDLLNYLKKFKTNPGRPTMPLNLAVMLFYAAHVAKYDNKQIIEIGEMLSNDGKIRRDIDSRFGEGTFFKLKIPSVDYASQNGMITARWIKPIKHTAIVQLTKERLGTPNLLRFIFRKDSASDLDIDDLKKVMKSLFELLQIIGLEEIDYSEDDIYRLNI